MGTRCLINRLFGMENFFWIRLFFFFLVGLILLLLNNVKTPMQHVNFLDWIVLNCFCPEKKEKKSCIWKWAAPTERCVSFTNWCHIERQRLNVCNKDQKPKKQSKKKSIKILNSTQTACHAQHTDFLLKWDKQLVAALLVRFVCKSYFKNQQFKKNCYIRKS